MMQRKTEQDYHEAATERGFKWIGDYPSSVNEKTRWSCGQHEWNATYVRIKYDQTGCPDCWRETFKRDYHEVATVRGFEYLEDESPLNTKTKVRWRCSQGHIWSTTYDHIVHGGHGCPRCAEQIPRRRAKPAKTTEHYHAAAKQRGFEWVSTLLPSTTHTRTRWRCAQGHEWEATYNNIVFNNSGCPYCAGSIPLTADDYHRLANNKGIQWIGDFPPNTETKTLWRCKYGHEWRAAFHNMGKHTSSGCPFCARKAPKSDADYHAAANSRGFTWIGSLPVNTRAKTLWRCKYGHEWRATYVNVVHSRSGCPHCVDMVNGSRCSKPQQKLCELLGGQLNYRVGRYVADIALFVGGISIDVEYDSWYWHKDTAERDAKRNTKLIQLGWRVLRIKTNNLIPSEEQLRQAIDHLLSGEVYTEIVLGDWGGK